MRGAAPPPFSRGVLLLIGAAGVSAGFFGLGVAFFVDAFFAEDLEEGGQEDFHVEPEGSLLDITDVEFEFFFDGEVGTAGDLGQSGDAGLDFEAAFLSGVPFGDLGHVEGARADEGHLAKEDVEELGEFVEGGFAEEAADFGQARILAGLWAGAEGVGVGAHGAELVEGEGLAAAAGTLLAEDGGAGGIEADKDGEDEHEGGEQDDSRGGGEEIEDSFGQVIDHGYGSSSSRRGMSFRLFVTKEARAAGSSVAALWMCRGRMTWMEGMPRRLGPIKSLAGLSAI